MFALNNSRLSFNITKKILPSILIETIKMSSANINVLVDAANVLERATTTKEIENLNVHTTKQLNDFGFFDISLSKKSFQDDVPDFFKIKSPTNDDKINAIEQLKKKYDALNKSLFPRFYDNNCRPPFVELSQENGLGISCSDIFFDSEGALKKNFCPDLDSEDFSFIELLGDNKDDRFMIPILESSPEMQAVRNLLVKNKIINNRDETIHGLVLIIGGTKEQNLHFDFQRNNCCFSKSRLYNDQFDDQLKDEYEVGWEVNREAYNNAMKMRNGHSSVLIDASKLQKGFKIAIPTKFFEFSDDNKHASIKNGNDRFKVVRKGSEITVINVSGGCQFTGDFAHCGANNVSDVPREKEFREMLQSIRTGINKKNISKKLFLFKGLSNFCRLFLKTNPNVTDPITISTYNVGVVKINDAELNFAETIDGTLTATKKLKSTPPSSLKHNCFADDDSDVSEGGVYGDVYGDIPDDTPKATEYEQENIKPAAINFDVVANTSQATSQQQDNLSPEEFVGGVIVNVPDATPKETEYTQEVLNPAATPQEQDTTEQSNEVVKEIYDKYTSPMKRQESPKSSKSKKIKNISHQSPKQSQPKEKGLEVVSTSRKDSLRTKSLIVQTTNEKTKPTSPKNITNVKKAPKPLIVQTINETRKTKPTSPKNITNVKKAPKPLIVQTINETRKTKPTSSKNITNVKEATKSLIVQTINETRKTTSTKKITNAKDPPIVQTKRTSLQTINKQAKGQTIKGKTSSITVNKEDQSKSQVQKKRKAATTMALPPTKKRQNKGETVEVKVASEASKERTMYRHKKKALESSPTPAIVTAQSSILSGKNLYNGFFSTCCNLNQYLSAFESTDENEDESIYLSAIESSDDNADDIDKKKANQVAEMAKQYLVLKQQLKNVIVFDKNSWLKSVNEKIPNSVPVYTTNSQFPIHLVNLVRNKGEKDMVSKAWFFVKRSTLKSFSNRSKVRMGVYAAREFKAYECLGLFIGMVKNDNKSYSKYSATSAFGNVDNANSFTSGNGNYHYGMAIQEINDPTQNISYDAEFNQIEAEAKVNTIMTDTLLLYSNRIIKYEDELFLKFKTETL